MPCRIALNTRGSDVNDGAVVVGDEAAMAMCITAEVRTKYGTKEGVRRSVYSCE